MGSRRALPRHLILLYPATDSMRCFFFGDSLSLYDLWSRPWRATRLLKLHGLPPCPPSPGRGQVTTTRRRRRKRKSPEASYTTSHFESQSQGISCATVGKQFATMVKFLITSQSIKDMTVEAVITNGLPLCTFEEPGIAKMLAPMLDQLNFKSTIQLPTCEHRSLMLIRERR